MTISPVMRIKSSNRLKSTRTMCEGATNGPCAVDDAGAESDSAPASSTAQGPFVAPSHIVRVDLSRLDDLMRITGEMVIQRARLEDQLNRLNTGERKVEIRGLNEVNIAL